MRLISSKSCANGADSAVHCCSSLRAEESEEDVKLVVVLVKVVVVVEGEDVVA